MILRKTNAKTMLTIGYALTLLLFTACKSDDDFNDDDDMPVVPAEPQNKTTGFVIEGALDGGTRVVKYFEELPTGTIDLSTDSQSFSTFLIRSLNNSAIFTQRTDGSDGFAKHVVNAEGQITEVGIIPLNGFAGKIKVKDSERGVFYIEGSTALTVFNPTTFEVTGTIDMGQAFSPEGVDYRYSQFGFRGETVYGAILPIQGLGFTSLIVHQADLSTNTYIGTTQRISDENNPSSIAPHFVENVDTPVTKDLYISDAGNIEASGVAARVNKIPVGSNEIDPDYIFEPSRVLNPSPLNLLPTISNFYNLGNDKAIAVVNKDLPDEVLAILTAADFNFANISSDDFSRAQQLLFSEATAVHCLLDLNAKTVTPIEGLPGVGPFSGAQTFEYNGDVYINVSNVDEDSYYKYNPTTGATSKAFDVIGAGGISVFNLEDNY